MSDDKRISLKIPDWETDEMSAKEKVEFWNFSA